MIEVCCLLLCLNLNFYYNAAVRLQAFNQRFVFAADFTFYIVAGNHRLRFTFGGCFKTLGINTLAYDVSLGSISTALRLNWKSNTELGAMY